MTTKELSQLEIEPSDSFLAKIEDLVGFHEPAKKEQMYNWIINCVEKLKSAISVFKLNYVQIDFNRLVQALELAYISHSRQERRSGEMYIEHIGVSLENYLEKIKLEEDVYAEKRKKNKIDLTDNMVKLALHDTLEDLGDNLIEKKLFSEEELDYFFTEIEKYDSEFYQNFEEELTQRKIKLYQSLIQYIELNFGKFVVTSLVYVFTKFSKRIHTTGSKRMESSKNSKDLQQPVLSKADVGRIDFLARLIGIVEETRRPIDLILTLCEKEHNLETPTRMHKRKLFEIYNLGVLFFSAGFRYYGKTLFEEIFNSYLKEEESKFVNPEVWQSFESKIQTKKRSDQVFFESHRKGLEQDLDDSLGKGNYVVHYHTLPDWRIHETLIEYYLKEIKRGPKYTDDILKQHFISSEILESPHFDKLLGKLFLGRVVIIVNEPPPFKSKNLKFNAFNIQSYSRVDYFYGNFRQSATHQHKLHRQEVAEDLLSKSGYKSLRMALIPKNDAENRFFEIKIVPHKQHIMNEFSKMSLLHQGQTSEGLGIFTEKYDMRSLNQFADYLRRFIGANQYDQFKQIALNPLGENLDSAEVFDLMRHISDKIKRLRIAELILTGGSTHS